MSGKRSRKMKQKSQVNRILLITFALVEINNHLGPLAVLLYKRLSKLKILSGLNSNTLHFIKPVLDYYEINTKKCYSDIKAAHKIK